MSNFQERLKELRGQTSQVKFAEMVGVPQTTLGRYERGESQPDVEFASHVCLALGVNPNWLLLGAGPIRQEHQPETTAKTAAIVPETLVCADCELVMVPMVEARLSAGNGSFEVGDNIEGRYAFRLDFLLRKGSPPSMVLMRVDGDSMEPFVLNGDVVLIDQSQRETRPGKVYAVGIEDAVYLKVLNTLPGKLVLTSHNAAYPPLEVDARGDLADGIRIIGRAVWVGRELY